MPLFAIIGTKPKPELVVAVEREFNDKLYLVAPNHWIVISEGTAQSVSDKLGVRGGALGNVLVYNIGGYYGYASTNLWEWMQSNGAPR